MVIKIFQNKTVVGVVCIIIAAVLAFILLPTLNKGKNNTEIVVKFHQAVAAGTKIDESMLMEQEVGSFGLPESAIRDKQQIIGKYTNCAITPEEFILSSKVSDYAADEKLDTIMSSGKMLITVSIDSIAAGVGNHLQAGDIISIISYAENAVNAYEELKNLEIYSVENADAQNIDETQGEEVERIVSSITVIVDQNQAEKLVLAEYAGKIHAVFVKRGVSQ